MRRSKTGHYGVYPSQNGKRFRAQPYNPLTGKGVYLGTYNTLGAAISAVERACKTMGYTPCSGYKHKTCKYGHILNDETRIISPSGRSRCKICDREYVRNYKRERYATDPDYRRQQLERRKAWVQSKKIKREKEAA